MGVEPYPEALIRAQPRAAPGRHARHPPAAALRLAFVAALQRLPGEQRAVLLLRDVLGFDDAEAGTMLGVPAARVALLLAAARRGLGPVRPPPADRAREQLLVAAFAAAFAAGDDAGALLAADVVLAGAEPRHGRAAVAAWLRAHRPAALSTGRAGGQPALACSDGVLVLETAGAAIAALTWFGDPGHAARLGLPAPR